MKTVFHIIAHLDLGGAERVAINIAKHGGPGFEHHIVCVIGSKGEYAESLSNELNDAGVLFHQGPSVWTKLAILLFPFRLLYLVLKRKPAVIHSHTEVPDLAVFLFYLAGGWMFKGIKYVRTIHNTVLWTDWGWIGDIVESFFRKKKSNIAIGTAVQKSYYDRFSELPPIVYNGLEPSLQKPFSAIDGSRINILFAGRFEWQKGIEEMIATFRSFSDDARFLFHIVGSGSMKQKVVDALGAQANVVLHDTIYSIASYLGSFDYLFMPSNHEGLSLLSIESSMAGTPVIINDCDGLSETLPPGWPLMVHDNSVNDYCHIFDTLDVFDRDELARRACEFVVDRFSAGRMSYSYESFYET